MNDVLRWLLDLDSLDPGAANVRFGFERPMPLWMWPGVFVGLALFAAWSYSRLSGARPWRTILAGARTLLLATLVVLIAGPRLVEREESVERDWVLVLVDRSESMTIEDSPADADAPGAGRTTREAQLRAALERSWPMWQALAEQRTLLWLGFDAGAYELDTGQDGVALTAPQGRRTSIAAALDQALRRAAARPLSSVVILSDGRSIDEPSRAALRRLQAERIPVHVLPLGSDEPVGDLAVRRVDGPGAAFIGDIAPVRVEVDRVGAASALGGTLRLVDAATGITLDEQRIEPAGAGENASATDTVILTHRPEDAGQVVWRVELEPDAGDLISGNNAAELSLELLDRPMRVLYVDGHPRWEQRYLKNLLIREASIRSSNLLLAPDRRYLQEGDVEVERLPDSPEEWAEFDVIVMGDVHPEVFTSNQLEHLRDHIAIRGGGLLWVAGPGATPDAWWDSPLADLLPFSREGRNTPIIDGPVLMSPTDNAVRLGVLRLGGDVEHAWPPALADASLGWPLLQWSQRIAPAYVKPTAEVLANAAPHSALAESTPLVLAMRYGAGRIVYVATDEIWRWRYGRGELLPERFWLQLVRMLGRESVSRAGLGAVVVISPRRATVGQPVRVSVELLDQALVELGLSSIAVRLERRPEPGETEADRVPAVELALRPDSADARTYAATWLPQEAGEWTATPAESALAGLGLTAEGVVLAPDDELRRPESDHALLASLSEATGGRVIPASDLAVLPDLLPNRRVRLVHEKAESLWDTPLALLVVVVLLTLEWVGRRFIRLI